MTITEILISLVIYGIVNSFILWIMNYIGLILPTIIITFMTFAIYLKIILRLVGRHND